ncbi:MAG TPA: GNAT family N-acetyltransferase [Mycobacteriales bacterium]|jgi:GNAT superfamily N-acetyltransferase|nr:GNAT family N-acetyltransferase [Mycobacteriales bacterium]
MIEQLSVREATAGEVLPLRMAVLRPSMPVELADYDAYAETRHVAAFADDVVLGCATVFPSPYEDIDAAWQLRGMAVAAGRQGQGIGALVLSGAIELVRVAGAPVLWANARTTALVFYERLGFTVIGEEYLHGALKLPHKLILLTLDAV